MDGSSELCKLASNYIRQKVICREFNDLHERNAFDAVWACASILHIPRYGWISLPVEKCTEQAATSKGKNNVEAGVIQALSY